MLPYVHNTPADQKAMLAAIGAASIDELLSMVPDELRLKRELELPPALTEIELTQHLSRLASKNIAAGQVPCFLGGGSYDHFIPAAIDALAGRGEFYTSYTPYQPEVSQGNLQAMFEYQSLICRLTGMDVSNASLYDGGSATVEAALLCMAATSRPGKVVTTSGVHPEYREILSTYFATIGAELITVGLGDGGSGNRGIGDGTSNLDEVAAAVDDKTACIVVQHPNFFGCLEDVERLGKIAHAAGALLVVSFDPISVGLLKRPGDLGADVAVAEGQSLGSPMAYGGPYLGIMACKEAFMRRMPGRIAGETIAHRGNRCFVLTLQTREQHIRRDKATSNICTNQGLYALRASIYLSLMGPQGLRDVAELCLQKSHYAMSKLCESERYSQRFSRPFFKEFVIRDSQGQVAELLAEAQSEGVLAGLPLGRWYSELDDCFLVAVTEKRTKEEIDRLAECLSAVEAVSA